ncbi:uncharacterized protein UBRO_21037 [Ustilago bromivora]|uniref:Uncharacterized protein n=1 Tax=Ustilago bromivora TaxID=307758 RepID=A0A1K0FVT8_9BASI|nr:uncharacterized protein UBRO_21037 [Ustilago bromivora]
MPWLQPTPCMPALPAKAPNDTMSDAHWQGYHPPSLQEGDLMVSMPSHSGNMLLAVPPRSEPTSAPLLLPGRPYNTPHRSERSSAPSHLPGQHSIEPTWSVAPQATSLRSETLFKPSSLPGWLTIAPSLPGQRPTAPLFCPPLGTFPAGIIDLWPDLASDCLLSLITGLIPPPPRPNTLCELPIFDATNIPAMCVVNLPMDSDDVHHLCHEIEAHLAEGRLRHVTNPVSSRLACSPVGVVPKPHSDKRRTIYHLSHPRKPGTCLPSFNDGIHTSFVTIHYESSDVIMDFICEHPSSSLWKADLEDAF